ncbi:hypothetical protein ABT354_20290 [Streptomyces sp. NPDC000594]|uniref:hypothetical protein n=1 Tax=unclassified Streptomyces TaxID=2593676 RepID=UPI00331F8BFA
MNTRPTGRRTVALCAIGVPAVLASTAGGRTAAAVCGAAILLLVLLLAVLAVGAAYARRPEHRTAARRTLQLLLGLAPWYRVRR